MRRLGDAAHLLHIRPWEWERMTVEETEHVLGWLDAYEKAQQQAAEKVKSRR